MTKLILAAALCFAGHASGVEIATGKMLGKGYETRAFYLRGKNGRWTKTYSGRSTVRRPRAG